MKVKKTKRERQMPRCAFFIFLPLIEGAALRGPCLCSLNNTEADYEVIIKHKSECNLLITITTP